MNINTSIKVSTGITSMLQKYIIVTLVFLLLPQVSFATGQAPDYLIYNFEKNAENQKRRPMGDCGSSGNWRGYIATFSIQENKLFIKNISVENPKKESSTCSRDSVSISVLETTFPTIEERSLDWFTGVLVAPKGKRLEYVHMGYLSSYERYLLIKIKDGEVKKSAELTLDEYRDYKKRVYAVPSSSESVIYNYDFIWRTRAFTTPFHKINNK